LTKTPRYMVGHIAMALLY